MAVPLAKAMQTTFPHKDLCEGCYPEHSAPASLGRIYLELDKCANQWW